MWVFVSPIPSRPTKAAMFILLMFDTHNVPDMIFCITEIYTIYVTIIRFFLYHHKRQRIGYYIVPLTISKVSSIDSSMFIAGGGHYAMKPSVILKQKNPEFSKLPS